MWAYQDDPWFKRTACSCDKKNEEIFAQQKPGHEHKNPKTQDTKSSLTETKKAKIQKTQNTNHKA